MAIPHLPVYRRWKDRAPTGGLKPDSYLTEGNIKKMDAYGFPRRIGQAFLQTADTLKSVILPRTPGKAATGLIGDGYCLKSYFVKAKSCH